jgi:gas vesicle protein
MNNEGKGLWQIRLIATSIFVFGVITGVGGLYSYQSIFSPAKQPTIRERYQEAFNNLDMSSEQREEVQKIVGELKEKLSALRAEAQPRVQEIRAESDEKLQKVLTPEQWEQFREERELIRQTEKNRYKK